MVTAASRNRRIKLGLRSLKLGVLSIRMFVMRVDIRK
jgi:hypothetical protein